MKEAQAQMKYILWQFAIIAIVWSIPAFLLLWPLYIVPDSYFAQFRVFHIDDAFVGDNPKAVFDRDIKHRFSATWHGQVRRIAAPGRYNIACWSSGEGIYDEEIHPPDNLTLQWFTYPNKCMYEPGQYYIHSVWTLHLQFGNRDISVDSNVFTIKGKQS